MFQSSYFLNLTQSSMAYSKKLISFNAVPVYVTFSFNLGQNLLLIIILIEMQHKNFDNSINL